MIVSNIQSPSQVTPEEVVVMCSIKEQYWPHSMESQLKWWERYTGKDDVLITLVNDGSILAFLRLRKGSILSNGECLVALCATEVCVSKEYRGQGRGKQLLGAATTYINRVGVNLGYLLCWSSQVEFYRACDWSQLIAIQIESTNTHKSRPLTADERCMVYDPHSRLNGQITLVGDQF